MVEPTSPRNPSGRPRPLGTARAAIVLLLAAVAAGAVACAPLGQGENPFGEGGEGARSIRIEVQNLNFNDATLHAVSSGNRYRMGTVSGKSSATFEVPWESQASLRIEIDLLAGPDHTTRPVTVSPRERVQLFIQPDLQRSYVQL